MILLSLQLVTLTNPEKYWELDKTEQFLKYCNLSSLIELNHIVVSDHITKKNIIFFIDN